jgi:hypothetical protein
MVFFAVIGMGCPENFWDFDFWFISPQAGTKNELKHGSNAHEQVELSSLCSYEGASGNCGILFRPPGGETGMSAGSAQNLRRLAVSWFK